MNTRDIVLVGAGVVVGYLLVGYLNKSKDNAQTSTDSSGSSEPKNQILFDCEKMWQERAEMIKGTPEFLLKQKEGFLSLCKEGKIDFTKDYGNGLFVTYKNDCNKIIALLNERCSQHSKDNYTAIVLKIEGTIKPKVKEEKDSLLSKILNFKLGLLNQK
jgi:hypothetical protein